jgi:predicted CXXCH cytochrome family protein
LGSVLLLASWVPSGVMAGTIVGSDHDFSGQGWSGGEICVACHTPHNSDTSVAEAPLWNHTLTTSTFTVYTSGTMDSTPGQPDGISKLCLSCHDGTVALDSFGGASGSSFMTGPHRLGTDLSDDHPISMTYDAALATADPGLNDPTATNVVVGQAPFTDNGTITDVMLSANKVQCSSCHDVHNNEVISGSPGDPLLRVSKSGSAICLTCHNK